MNCCQLCKNKNPSQIYYLCRTCSNLIICGKCYINHNKNDDIERLNKIDSLCRKHFNQIESYCDICKENKCSYCESDHDKTHKNREYLLKDIFLDQSLLDRFVRNYEDIFKIKSKIEENINKVIKELKNKIELLKNLKIRFNESLEAKIKISNLVYQNYQAKLKKYDLNYFTIKNLKDQINFKLLNFENIKENNLDKRIEQLSSYINNNINIQFNNESNEIIKSKEMIGKEDNKKENHYNIDINYKISKEFNINNIIGYINFNDEFLIVYSKSSIFFIYKKVSFINYFLNNISNIKFEIKEYNLNNILTCKKILEDQI